MLILADGDLAWASSDNSDDTSHNGDADDETLKCNDDAGCC